MVPRRPLRGGLIHGRNASVQYQYHCTSSIRNISIFLLIAGCVTTSLLFMQFNDESFHNVASPPQWSPSALKKDAKMEGMEKAVPFEREPEGEVLSVPKENVRSPLRLPPLAHGDPPRAAAWRKTGLAANEKDTDAAIAVEVESNRLPPPDVAAAATKRIPKATIGYAISLTGCPEEYNPLSPTLLQGAAVLAHSIYLQSIRNFDHSGSVYDYALYAFVHPVAVKCSVGLDNLGYKVLIKETPVNVTEIRGEYLRTHVTESGCCAEKEYLKLYSYNLGNDHEIVVHLDVDALILKPLDALWDVMLDGSGVVGSDARKRIKTMFGKAVPERVDAFFTRDYGMLPPGHRKPGIQGGFLAVRTSRKVFEEYREIILDGNFEEGDGWGKLGYGGYWGDRTIQGLCSYYYDHLHPGTAVELDECLYNAMVGSPKFEKEEEIQRNGGLECMTGMEECDDCRLTNVEDIVSAHFTICQKPWWCPGHHDDVPGHKLCKALHAEWFRIRKDLGNVWADKYGVDNSPSEKNFEGMETFKGYCSGHGEENYVPLNIPEMDRPPGFRSN